MLILELYEHVYKPWVCLHKCCNRTSEKQVSKDFDADIPETDTPKVGELWHL